MVDKIEVRGARVHNLKNIDVDVPLNEIVAIAGVSGSGKSSLALGVLYSEGSRRYLESLSTYTRRRMTEAPCADVDQVLYVPASLALHQRPAIAGIRSTFGTSTELLNVLRLMFSRLASHRCPNGHYVQPTLAVASGEELSCPVCGAKFHAPSAEELSFNSQGACEKCNGTGVVWSVDRSTLVPDESLSIDQGAVAPWKCLMWSLMTEVCKQMGVRTDVPFGDLTEKEKEIVYDGPLVKKHILYKPKNGGAAAELDFTYYSAVKSVENALSKVKDEQGIKRISKFLKEDICPECHGTRLSDKARSPLIEGFNLPDVCAMPLSRLCSWVQSVPNSLPVEMRKMAKNIVQSFLDISKRLMDLGLGYLSLDRAQSTLSNGERQRMQLARAVRNSTTGVLYVLDEPSIGLHPSNIEALVDVMHSLINDGNSVVLVDHDTDILNKANYMIEMGPGAGDGGGEVIANGTIDEIKKNEKSRIAPFLAGERLVRKGKTNIIDIFSNGKIELKTKAIHTVKPLFVEIPKGRMTVVTGVSGSGKTTMVLESLAPAIEALIDKKELPENVVSIKADNIRHVKLIDATPIGINVRSTLATYANIHDELRKVFSKTPLAKQRSLHAGDFSYNTGALRCKKCDGTGSITLDVQFLPDVLIQCPDCHGSRYSKEAYEIKYKNKKGCEYSLPELMSMDVADAIGACSDIPLVKQRLDVLQSIGLGYLELGEDTPSLSGGEAQRLKLASEMKKAQDDSLFIFDEPTIGLHPLDVEVLLSVFDSLLEKGATIIVIEHDLSVIKNADYIIDMGPGGGDEGGNIVYMGPVDEIKKCKDSVTAKYI